MTRIVIGPNLAGEIRSGEEGDRKERGVAVSAYYPSMQKAEAGGRLQVQDQSRLHSKL